MPELIPDTRMRISVVVLSATLAFLLGDSLNADDFPAPHNSEPDLSIPLMPAKEAAEQMQVPEGFKVSVLAAEPDVQNPIAMAWDRRGRLWIAENYTYAESKQRFHLSLRDRVLVFEDADRDGVPESRTVFTDNVQMLTSVEVGRGGVWLMCPPQVMFIPDADGDLVPDGPPQVVLDGFTVAQANYHNFANGLRWGPDGWLYGRCGHSCPGRLGVPGTPDEQRIPIRGGIWRFHPERKIVEVLCHGTTNPWGHDWDENGELFFINTVNGHLWHSMPGAHFKESFGNSQNPGVYERLDTIADHWHFDTTGKWHESRNGKANEYGGGHAHIGTMIYQGRQWPEQYHNRLFTLNMHGLRANVERLEREGAGYVGRHQADVFISADRWFRGMDLSTGPDGAAYVIDWSDTGECHEHTGVHRTSGRIFRIAYEGDTTAKSQAPETDLLTPRCLMGDGLLPKLWKQYQAGETTPAMLRELLSHRDEHVRVWAIRLLTDFWPLDTLMGPQSTASLSEKESSGTAQAVRPDAATPIAAGRLAPLRYLDADNQLTYAALLNLAASDESGLVKLQLASTLQRLPIDRRAKLAAALVTDERFAADPYLPALTWYGLIPLGKHAPQSLVEIARNCRWPLTLQWISRSLASRIESSPAAVNSLLELATKLDPALRQSVLSGMGEAFQGWRKAPQPAAWRAFAASFARPDNDAAETTKLIRELNVLFGDGRALGEIRKLVLDGTQPLPTRQTALQTLIDARPDDLRGLCESLLNERVLNATAARGLALFDDPAIGKRLVESYRRFDPRERQAVLNTLVSRASFAATLLDSLGDGRGRIPRSDVTSIHARQILAFNDEKLSKRLAETWGVLRDTSEERQQLMSDLRTRLSPETLKQADLASGRQLFQKTCANCHKLYGEGKPIGPDLTGSQRANLDYLLQNVVDPSAQVPANYRVSVVTLKDGRVLSGIVGARNNRTLTVQTATDSHVIELSEIESETPSPLSIMPDNQLQTLTEDQQRDLFAYLMHPVQVAMP
jgi:putative membrane-bound dehydrogenase-like protein